MKKALLFSIVLIFTVFIVKYSADLINFENFSNKTDNSDVNISEELEITEPTTLEPVVLNAEITAVGDLMVHSWQLNNAYIKTADIYDFNYTFEPVRQYLQNADLTVGNLETTMAGKERGYSDYPCFNTPSEFLDAIKDAGFDLLTTANNHCMDTGEQGILNTIKELDARNIGHFGTYSSYEEYDNIFVCEAEGIKFAFVSWTYGTNGIPIPDGKEYLVKLLTEESVKTDLHNAKKLNPDIIIAMPHMGNEYEDYPNDIFKEWVNLIIEEGADVVLASHPHVLQPMEFRNVLCDDGTYKTAFVAYSLANFISSQRTVPRDTGVILNLYFEKKGDDKAFVKSAEYIPTWVQWRDITGNYNIRVLTVYDAVKSYLEGGNKYGLRPKDFERLKSVQKEAIKAVSGIESDITQIEPYYTISNDSE